MYELIWWDLEKATRAVIIIIYFKLILQITVLNYKIFSSEKKGTVNSKANKRLRSQFDELYICSC